MSFSVRTFGHSAWLSAGARFASSLLASLLACLRGRQTGCGLHVRYDGGVPDVHVLVLEGAVVGRSKVRDALASCPAFLSVECATFGLTRSCVAFPGRFEDDALVFRTQWPAKMKQKFVGEEHPQSLINWSRIEQRHCNGEEPDMNTADLLIVLEPIANGNSHRDHAHAKRKQWRLTYCGERTIVE